LDPELVRAAVADPVVQLVGLDGFYG